MKKMMNAGYKYNIDTLQNAWLINKRNPQLIAKKKYSNSLCCHGWRKLKLLFRTKIGHA